MPHRRSRPRQRRYTRCQITCRRLTFESSRRLRQRGVSLVLRAALRSPPFTPSLEPTRRLLTPSAVGATETSKSLDSDPPQLRVRFGGEILHFRVADRVASAFLVHATTALIGVAA